MTIVINPLRMVHLKFHRTAVLPYYNDPENDVAQEIAIGYYLSHTSMKADDAAVDDGQPLLQYFLANNNCHVHVVAVVGNCYLQIQKQSDPSKIVPTASSSIDHVLAAFADRMFPPISA